MRTHTPISLKRWSCKSKSLPDVSAIKALHVYDFDNTLFMSPLPNPQIWDPSTLGLLQSQDTLAYGGWWHDPHVLEATGEGVEKEEPRAWNGWWNEAVLQLVELSIQTADVLTVLLTGRGEDNFASLINRICDAKKLDFDLVVLKPETSPSGTRFDTTMLFKQAFLKDMIFTYKNAEEVRVYEDRPKHVKGFRDYFEKLNKSLLSHPVDEPPPPRGPINAEVVAVCELKSTLNPETEIEVVQRAITRHNQAISTQGPSAGRGTRKPLTIVDNFAYFGYLINQTDSARLLTLFNLSNSMLDSGEVRLLASSILITPYYPRGDIIKQVGGRGKKVTWQVTGTCKYEDRIWAARVSPVSETQIYTKDATPHVVLAIRKGSRQVDATRISDWYPVPADKAFIFETTVGEKMTLKIDESPSTATRSGRKEPVEGGQKRKFPGDDANFRNREPYARASGGAEREDGTWAPRGAYGGGRFTQRNQNSKANFNNRQNPNQGGGRGNNPGGHAPRGQRGGYSGAGGGGGRGRNNGAPRGGPPGYKSLDDYGPGNFDGASDPKLGSGEMVMNY